MQGPIKVLANAAAKMPDAETLEAVEAIWQAETRARGDALHNGRIFGVCRKSETQIEGGFVDYKWFLAQQRKPTLYPKLGVDMLAVSGLLVTSGSVVFGRRGTGVTQDSGKWELLPSGGVSPDCCDEQGEVHPDRQLLQELAEEAGLAAASVTQPEPFAIVEDTISHVIDVGFFMHCRLDSCTAGRLLGGHSRSEYEAVEIVPISHLPDFISQAGSQLVTVSRVLLEEAGMIPARQQVDADAP